MNTVNLTGRLVRENELKQLGGNSNLQNVIAVRRSFKNASGEYETDFINIVAWRGQAVFNFISQNKKELIEVILGTRGYRVEKPLYQALIKGHELVHDYNIYWNCDKYDNDVFVSRLHPPLDNFTTELTKEEWNELGINDSNADFVRVEEMAE